LRAFRNKILPDGTLDDRASPELARIRREIEKQRRVDSGISARLFAPLAEGGAVQDELVTIRGERFVIPVKIEQKRRVQGVVHGASSSGQTVFVEPLETIEQNNELVRLLDEEQAEIHRILLEMTRRIGENAEDNSGRGRCAQRTRIAVRQGALRRRIQLRGRVVQKDSRGDSPPRPSRVERRSPRPAQCAPSSAGTQTESKRRPWFRYH
jgi:hypothetical protein